MDQTVAGIVLAVASAGVAAVAVLIALSYRTASLRHRARADALSALCAKMMLDDDARMEGLDEYARMQNIVIVRASASEQARRLGDPDDPAWLREAGLILQIPDQLIAKDLDLPASEPLLRHLATLVHRRALDAAKGKLAVVPRH
jgi:hypothetical protein